MAARPDERADIDVWTARLRDEMSRPRPADAPELDRVTVAEWLDGAPACVHDFFERWCGQLLFASTIETSLYGLMLVWGDQRTSAFATEPVARGNRGDTVFRGGTGALTRALAAASGATILTRTAATRVVVDANRCRIEARGPDGPVVVHARQAVAALPATVAREAIVGLPAGKAAALGRVRYGRNIATPIAVLPQGRRAEPFPLAPSRHDAVYCANGFVPRTPGDVARDGGCFHSYIHDRHARVVWDDGPDSIRSGAFRAFSAAHPDLAERVHFVGFKRWRHALPHMYPGRMADLGLLRASVGPIHFCGDYTWTSNMDGAARSGDAAAGVRAALEGRAAAS